MFSGSTQFKYRATAADGYYRVIRVTPSIGLTLGPHMVVNDQYQVNPSALSSSVDAATVTLEIAARYGGVDTLFTKVISYSKSKTGATGAKGDKGDPGAPGEKGDPGPGIVYRGTFSSTAKYYNNDKRRDVVTYNAGDGDKYYLYKGPDDASGAWNISNWEEFGAQFDSVATDILLTKDATITKTLNIGETGRILVGDPGDLEYKRHILIYPAGLRITDGSLIFMSSGLNSVGDRNIYSGLGRDFTTDPEGTRSVGAPVEISSDSGITVFRGGLTVYSGANASADNILIDNGYIEPRAIKSVPTSKLDGNIPIDKIPENVWRAQVFQGVDGLWQFRI